MGMLRFIRYMIFASELYYNMHEHNEWNIRNSNRNSLFIFRDGAAASARLRLFFCSRRSAIVVVADFLLLVWLTLGLCVFT